MSLAVDGHVTSLLVNDWLLMVEALALRLDFLNELLTADSSADSGVNTADETTAKSLIESTVVVKSVIEVVEAVIEVVKAVVESVVAVKSVVQTVAVESVVGESAGTAYSYSGLDHDGIGIIC